VILTCELVGDFSPVYVTHTAVVTVHRTEKCTYWLCSVRRPGARCTASVLQHGSHFKRGNNQHIHEPHVDALVTTKVQAAVRTKAKADVHRPAQCIVQEALQEHISTVQPLDAMPQMPSIVSFISENCTELKYSIMAHILFIQF